MSYHGPDLRRGSSLVETLLGWLVTVLLVVLLVRFILQQLVAMWPWLAAGAAVVAAFRCWSYLNDPWR
ncbi:hypothetical protein OAC41_05530 [Acidimicrobiales bacterium]|nr:hypothetical protein [Acidimicrobiales bacterium]